MSDEQDDGQDEPLAAREVARDLAVELRTQRRKTDRRRLWALRGGIAGALIAIVVAVVLVLVTTSQVRRSGPRNMQSDGIVIGAGLVAARSTALDAGQTPMPAPAPSASAGADVIQVRIYVDYLCADCGDFQSSSGDQLQKLVDAGLATVEIHPLAILTAKSGGTQYSLRAANAAACVAQYAPDQFFAFNAAMFAGAPKEGSEGLTDAQILKRAASADVASMSLITSCVEKRTFKNWVQAATTRAISGPLPGTDVPAITSPLTVLVDGRLFTDSFSDPNAFAQFVLQAAGEGVGDPTSTPTPTPTPTVAPAP